MYSLVLMATMTASAPEIPQFGIRGRLAAGCFGCVGSCYGYVVGYSWGGCFGYSCYGCAGGCIGFYQPVVRAFWPWWRPVFWGVFRPGPVWVVSGGPIVADAGPHVTPLAPTGDVWGANYYYTGKTPFVPLAPQSEPKKPETDPNLKGTSRLILEVPADAKVFVDGQETKSTSAIRQFHTPQLDENQAYFYDVKVVIPAGDNPPVELNRRVYVRANQIVRERFDVPANPGEVVRR